MPVQFRSLPLLAALCLALAGAGLWSASAHAQQEIQVPAWFKITFLDLRDDLREAAAGKRRLMVYFGQNGCPYCKRLMQVNFQSPPIVAKTRAHFDVIEINILGSREVTGADGSVQTEKAFARSLGVGYTPALLVLDERGAVLTRISGYLPPPAFAAALDYVIDGAYRREPDLQRYLKSRGEAGIERGSRSESAR
jgi:thioredoxin-related protein